MQWRAALAFLLLLGQDTLRVNTHLVQIDVVVRDKNGPVAGLTKEDFTILDSGKPQRIDVFSVSAPATPNTSTPKPGFLTNRGDFRNANPATATVVLFDMLNTPLQYQKDGMRQLLRYLKSLEKSDRMALYILENELHVVQDFTDDPEALVRAAADIKPAEVAGSELRSIRDITQSLGGGRRAVRMAFAIAANARAQRVDPTADAIEAISRHLAGLPGRKNLVWMSANIPLTPVSGTSRDGKESQIERAARLLNDSGVAIYPIDIRGLLAPELAPNTSRRGRPLESYPPPDPMVRLAEQTGGRASYFNNDLEGAVRSAVADGEASYTLGFYASEETLDGKFHSLNIKTTRKGITVHHRGGYYATKDPRPSEQERRWALENLMNSPLNAFQIGLSAHSEQDPASAGSFRVSVSIDAADVQMEHRNDRWTGELDVAVQTESSESAVKLQMIPINLTEEQFRIALQRGMTFDKTVAGRPSGDRARIVLQDRATGHAGSLWIPLN
jgi:VWFA-related protein